MLSRLVLSGSCVSKSAFNAAPIRQHSLIIRQFGRDAREQAREGFSSRMGARTRPSLKERLMAPAGPNAFSMGKGALVGGSALGLGALCFYGLGLGKGTSALNNSMLWPQYVKERIHNTYMYFGGSLAITALTALAAFRSPAVLNIVSRNGFLAIVLMMGAVVGSGSIAQSIPYSEGIGPKQFAWMAHCAILGAVIAPLCFLGGPILTRAALYSAGVVGGLSTVAVCAPSDKFLYMGGPLAIGLGVVFASTLASMWLPPTTALGAGLASMSLYGGLLLFSGFLLYDTQRIIRRAETHPMYAMQKFDPVNCAMSIYMDTLNIFIRIATLLAGGGSRRK
ncbi:growth hormone-inducible transmembrane protein-like [Phlebotomus argentipes]|uniref:growth hormone-inducible transmembrane protein-like n=1 Tax=Phlebotomus argentipes TaxID=94469 RepID=UPI0028934C6E|nr:growth hormone-inducible transmembrane protein-like [Phlebotomus argentipes]